MLCGADIGFQEQKSCILVRPVIWNNVFLLWVILNVFDDLLKGAKVFDQIVCCRGTNLGNRVYVIATEQNAEIDELRRDMSVLQGI